MSIRQAGETFGQQKSAPFAACRAGEERSSVPPLGVAGLLLATCQHNTGGESTASSTTDFANERVNEMARKQYPCYTNCTQYLDNLSSGVGVRDRHKPAITVALAPDCDDWSYSHKTNS